MERNNIFKYAKKELSQDAFICWLINYINTDDVKYKEVAKNFIKLIVEKIGDKRLINYIKENDYKVEIKHQYKKIDVLLKIDKFNIIIEDKIDTLEHDDQIKEYTYKLLKEGIEEKNIFTCYYKIYDEYKQKDKFVNSIITRKDMIGFLDTVDNKNLYMEDYYIYLKEIEKYSKKRDIVASEIKNIKSDIINDTGKAIYTGFYSELEEKEITHRIIGWGYADNRNGGTWWYGSKKFNNIKNKEFNRVYAEINLKQDRNYIILKLGKKHKYIILKEGENLQEKLDDSYIENGKIKYFDKEKYYNINHLNNSISEKYYCRCYKVLKDKVSIYTKVVTKELLKDLEKFGIYEEKNANKNTKGIIKEDKNDIYKYYTRIASINVNNYNLIEIEEILEVINKHLEKIRIEELK